MIKCLGPVGLGTLSQVFIIIIVTSKPVNAVTWKQWLWQAIHMYRNAIWFVQLQLAAVQTRWHWCTQTQYMQTHSLFPFPTNNQDNNAFSFSVMGVCVSNAVQVESRLRQSPLAPLAKPRFKFATKGATAVMCPFCKRNGETPEFYTTHKLKDCWGRVICPVLRAYTCPNCGISGDNAHTLNYCPYK